MGQKVSPIGMRVGIIRDWESRWFAEEEYGDLLQEDIKIRNFINKTYKKENLISRIEIERSKNKINLIIRTARPGNFIGSDGKGLEEIKKKLVKLTSGKEININIVEVGNPELDARLVAMKIAKLLEDRQSFRTAQKKAIQQTMRSGAKGIKTIVSGRLGGADIARSEGYSEGVVPLHTLRSDIDFAWEEAMTTYGKLGVKVWICRGEVLPGEMVQEPEKPKTMANPRNAFRRRNDRRNKVEQTASPVEQKIENKIVEEKQTESVVEEVKDGE